MFVKIKIYVKLQFSLSIFFKKNRENIKKNYFCGEVLIASLIGNLSSYLVGESSIPIHFSFSYPHFI